MRAFFIMFFLLFDLYDFETVITMFKRVFVGAVLDVVLEKLWYFYILLTVIAVAEKLTLFCFMQIIKIFISKSFALVAAVLTTICLLNC